MTIEEIVREKNRQYALENSDDSLFDWEVFTRDSTERKIRVAHYFAPILKEKFSYEFPSLDWDEISAELTVVSKRGPDFVNYHFSFIYGVAIFIIDSIYQSSDGREKMQKLKEILTDMKLVKHVDDDVFDHFDQYFRDMGNHPLYPEELIFRLSSLLAFRTSDLISYKNEKSHRDNYAFVADIYTTSLDKTQWKDKEREVRNYYEAVIDLVDPNDITDAVDQYEKLFFDLIERYIKCREKIRRKRERLESRKEYLDLKMEEVVFRDAEYSSEKGKILSSMMELKDEMDNFEQSNHNLPDAFTLGLFSLVELKKTYVTPLNGVHDIDPYKVISAFFFLFDNGDNRAWLLGPAMAALGFASNACHGRILFTKMIERIWICWRRKYRRIFSSAVFLLWHSRS